MPRRTKFEPPIYRFRVRIRSGFYAPPNAQEIWREIEIASNQTLHDLGEFIPFAFDFDDPHLWAFFLSGRAWDEETEYSIDTSYISGDRPRRPAHKTKIRDVPYPGKTGKKEFLYLFDFGDQWEFGVKLLGTSPEIEPGASYPRVAAIQGEAPPQYPHLEDEYDEEEGDAALDAEFIEMMRETAQDMQTVMDQQRKLLEEYGLSAEQITRVLEPIAHRQADNLRMIEQYEKQGVLEFLMPESGSGNGRA